VAGPLVLQVVAVVDSPKLVALPVRVVRLRRSHQAEEPQEPQVATAKQVPSPLRRLVQLACPDECSARPYC
jgi:hypothetical protein